MYSKSPLRPFDPVIQTTQPQPAVFRYFRDNFFGVGQDSYTHPPAQDMTQWELLTNVMPISQGILQRRWGYTSFATGLPATALRLYKYQNDTTGVKRILACSPTTTTVLDETGAIVTSNILTPIAATLREVFSRDYAYFTDGASQQKKWIAGGVVSGWGGAAEAAAVTYGANAGGAVTLLHGRRYYVVDYNSTTGHFTDLNPISALSSPICNQNQALVLPGANPDSQFDKKAVLATADGGDPTLLYFLTDGTANYLSAATTSYTDNTPDTTLTLQNVAYQIDQFGQNIGVVGNQPPPAGINFLVKHQGRLFGAVGRTLYFSKSIAELTTSTGIITGRYEECWPPEYFFDISEEAETIKGIYSDGVTLYIGTERHIRKLTGDGPLNFNKPEIIFSQVGLMNHDVWKPVFIEGTPAGTIWLTPDFRAIFSDFNVYRDVGTAIQDVLNSINPAALSACWSIFASTGPFDVYLLAIPTGSNTIPDTLCVFDMRTQKWVVWKPTSPLNYGLYNINAAGVPQWLVAGNATNLFQFQSSATTDSGTTFPVTMRTQWMHFGEPTSRKAINEIELFTEDVNLLTTVEGAKTGVQFNTPDVVLSNGALQLTSLGTYKVFLDASPAADRYYRATFTSNSTVQNLLESYTWELALFQDV